MKSYLKIFLGVLFFFVAVSLLVILWLPSVICALLFSFLRLRFREGMDNLGNYIYGVVQSIDQTGNVVAQHFFNNTLITKDGYKFGDVDETISSVLGKNEEAKTLTKTGKWLVKILDYLDPGHAKNSIGC